MAEDRGRSRRPSKLSDFITGRPDGAAPPRAPRSQGAGSPPRAQGAGSPPRPRAADPWTPAAPRPPAADRAGRAASPGRAARRAKPPKAPKLPKPPKSRRDRRAQRSAHRAQRSYRKAARKAARRDQQRAVAARGGWSPVDQGHMAQGAVAVVVEEIDDDFVVDPVYDADDRNWVRYRPFWGGFARLVVLVVVLVLAVGWVRGRIHGWVDTQITPEGLPGDAIELTIPQGASVNEIAGELQNAAVISNATVFRYWLRCDGELTIAGFLGCDTVVAVEAGDYILYENMDFESVRTVFDAGPLPEVFEIVRIPEGLRWSEMAVRLLEENPAFEREDLEAAYVSLVREASYLPEDAPVRSLEGMLFPATYDVNADDLGDEHGFLLRLSDEFDRRFARLLQDPGPHPDVVEMDLAPYDLVIVASLIEEEALVSEDRAKIARVIYNRLAEGWRLDIDATACYAAAKSCADLTSADISRDSPWNTRVVTGLPPTPISAPGEASLEAALQPDDGDWMFYVRTDEGGVRGAHRFAATYEEHLENVQVCRELGYC